VSRLPFIDWVRGVAVVAMVVWHTADGWLRPGLRAGEGWVFLRFFGGLAAPSFLFLAGMSAALAVRPAMRIEGTDAAQDVHRALRGAIGRGLEVALFGYLLRFQTWMVDAAEIRNLGHIHVWLPIGLGYATLWWSVNQLEPRARHAALGAVVGLGLCVLGFVQVEGVAPGRLGRLLQVDVLQAIGTSLVLLALLEQGLGLLQKPVLATVLGVAVAAATIPLSERLPGPLPSALAAYLGKWPSPQGVPAAALFPLFPWFAYACLGAALGSLLRTRRADPHGLLLLIAPCGAALALVTSESHPFMGNLHAAVPWLVSVSRVAYRVGIIAVLLLLGHVWTSANLGRIVLAYGKASLRVYWVHLLFAYGILGRSLQRKTSFAEWALWLLPLFVAMWALAKMGGKSPSKRAAPAGASAQRRDSA
jgi:uncharacterized membrane protein